MRRLAVGLLFVGVSVFANEPAGLKPAALSIRVECVGQLRHGLAVIGGESTGTTITFDRIAWELNLSDNGARKFAAEHHKQPVIVQGALRCLSGTERRV